MPQLFQSGELFHGSYTIIRLIGRGGIGEVYEAQHQFLGRRVAIKCMRMRATMPKTAAQRMAKEAQALCALDHPNIIRIFDAGLLGEIVFMVTELLEGGTLRDKLDAERRIALAPALRHHLEWADALVQVHAAGIIHRDVKPENVFLTTKGPAKLLDFGAALDSQRITMQGHTVGTPAYMAPEHLVGDKDIDARADVYPMGMMLFEALTGQHPFVTPADVELPDHFEFARRHLYEPWPKLCEVLPGTPAAVQAIVDRCLAKNRDERFASMSHLRDALAAALEQALLPQPVPLTNRMPPSLAATKPMPRQTAMRLERGMTLRAPPMTERMTPAPQPAAPVPLGPRESWHTRAVAPTMEAVSPLGAVRVGLGGTAPPMPAQPAQPTPVGKSGGKIAFLFIAVACALAAAGWFALRLRPVSPESAPSATVSAAPAPIAASVEPPAEPAATAEAASASPDPSTAPSAEPTSAPAVTAERKTLPTQRPLPAAPKPKAKPSGPVPMFER